MLQSIYYPKYVPKYWLIQDKPVDSPVLDSSDIKESAHKVMLAHVYTGNYISVLTSIMQFFEESISDQNILPEMRDLQRQTVKEVISDLAYLDKYYTIVPKTKIHTDEEIYKKS